MFKSEMDAEEARPSLPDPKSWEPDGPPDPDHALAALKEMSSRGCSHALINPPPSDPGSAQAVPIEDVIDHVKSRGHIRDLAKRRP